MIPKQLLEARFNRVAYKDKKAFEMGWQQSPYTYDQILKFLPRENYGVVCGEIRALDDDTKDKKLIKLFEENFGKTFRVRDHLYFKFDNNHQDKIIFYDNGEHLGELQGKNTYVVGAGSVHPSGEKYEVIEDVDIITISYDKFMDVFSSYIKSKNNPENIDIKINLDEDFIIKQVRDKWVEGDRQNLAMDLAGYLRKNKRLGLNTAINIITKICQDMGDSDINERIASVKSTYAKDESEIKGISGLKEREIKTPTKNLSAKIGNAFHKKDIAQRILEEQPCFYDKSRIWWIWNSDQYKWEVVDETDILNIVDEQANINTINATEKNEMIEALKQVSRKNAPKQIDKNWIQFRDKIVDIKTTKVFDATPEYFVTNPIPFDIDPLDKNPQTPNMDRIFTEWVGEDHVQTLYEILAYCLLPDYPIHRIFCFIGGGMNGKSKFLDLLRKFVGNYNCCSTELDVLLQSRFEVSRLHKKLVCQMGETNFNEMSKTSTLKKLSGGDLIGFEYKRKDPFEDINFAKILIATNNLPATTDKTIGFYRRWMIIDFPNQFSEKKDILNEIPEEEYNALALKCARILNDLLIKRKFTNEGSIEDRMKKYEDRSNPLDKFLKEFTEEEANCYIFKHDFSKKLNEWLKNNRFREISDVNLGKKMKELGFDTGQKTASWDINKRYRAYLGIKWR